MSSDEVIGTALSRTRKAIELRPSLGQGTMAVKLHLDRGIHCVTQSDQWRTEIDDPASYGGEDSAPSPSVYGFSALASCLAMSIKMLAVQSGTVIETIDVEVESDYDERAFFDLGDAQPGYQNFRMRIQVKSDAPEEVIEALVAEAREKSNWFNTFSRPNAIETSVDTTPSG